MLLGTFWLCLPTQVHNINYIWMLAYKEGILDHLYASLAFPVSCHVWLVISVRPGVFSERYGLWGECSWGVYLCLLAAWATVGRRALLWTSLEWSSLWNNPHYLGARSTWASLQSTNVLTGLTLDRCARAGAADLRCECVTAASRWRRRRPWIPRRPCCWRRWKWTS